MYIIINWIFKFKKFKKIKKIGHLIRNLIWKDGAKQIQNDEVIKQFVYLVSKIDWVLNGYPITTP